MEKENYKEESEEKEVMTISDHLEKCTLCGKDGAYINDSGVFICNDCFLEQKREIFNLYLNKPKLFPSYNLIKENIFLGNEDTARDKKLLINLNISHILICAEGCEPFFKNEFIYKTLYLDDAVDENLLDWVKEAIEFIDSAENNIYIHCAMGISRSPSIVISYLMYKYKMKYNDAFDFVKSKRNEINPNSGFRTQLQQFEKILIDNNYVLPDNLGQYEINENNKDKNDIKND